MTALTNNELTDDVLEYVLAVVEDRYENRKSNAGEDDRIILALRELQKRRKASKEPVRYLNKFSGVCVTLEQQSNAADDVAVYIPLYTAPPAQETNLSLKTWTRRWVLLVLRYLNQRKSLISR